MWSVLVLSAVLAGTLEGMVVFMGDAPVAPTEIENTTDPEVCGVRQSLENLVVDPESGGVRYAIVVLQDVLSSEAAATAPQTIVLDNVGCRFEPHAAVATVGSTLEAANSDPVLHTTHLYGPTELNVSLPLRGMTVSRTLRRPGLYVVKCDVHGWMQAFVRVDEHPFHAVTNATGSFRIQDVPAGSYRLEVWHETLGAKEIAVTVEPGETTAVTIEYGGEEEDTP